MRARIVIIVLVAGIGLISLLAIFRGNRVDNQVNPETNPSSQTEAQPKTEPVRSEVGVIATTQMEDSNAKKQQDLDVISDALLSDNQEQSLGLIGDRLYSHEMDVRSAAVDAMRHLGNSNAVPMLSNALQYVEDPREKVAILDTIEYLKTPSESPPTNGIDWAEMERRMLQKPVTNAGKNSIESERLHKEKSNPAAP